VVLIGDAAHTAHFSIGSGTKLAMEDSAALVQALRSHANLEVCLSNYETARRPAVERFQEAALQSADYFAHVGDLDQLPSATFVFNLATRSGRVSHLDLQRQDPDLVLRANGAAFASDSTPLPPALAPITLGRTRLANRLIGGSLGMTLSRPISVIADGQPRLDADVVVLTHDGPRSGGRSPEDGLDRPRLDGGNSLAASSRPYTRFHTPPREATAEDLAEVVEAFARAAKRLTGRAQLLHIDGAGGRLLASFISPLTNQRTDTYGGDVTGRLRFPLSVVQAVRSSWEGPLGFRFSATDWAPGGITEDDAVAVAARVAEAGADFVEVSGGGAVAEYDPPFRAGYLVPLAARIRNRADVPVLVGGGITSIDQANTIIAAGRADLVRLS
jgi:anthraniloyl-CoA monooxygenase